MLKIELINSPLMSFADISNFLSDFMSEKLPRAGFMDWERLKGGNSGLLKKVKEVLGTTLGAWQDAEVDEGTPALSAPSPDAPLPEPERLMRSALLRFCAVAWGVWDAERHRRGLLSFSDMILQARVAVESGKAQRTFRHILVDDSVDRKSVV